MCLNVEIYTLIKLSVLSKVKKGVMVIMSNIKAITKPISIEEVIEIAEEKLINNPSDEELKTLIQKLKDMKIG